MSKGRAIPWIGGLALTVVGVGLDSYHFREALAVFAIFTLVFLLIAMLALLALLVWCASEQLALWCKPLTQLLANQFRRLFLAYARR